MKKALTILLSLALLTAMLTGCGQSAQPSGTMSTPTVTAAPGSSQAEPTPVPEESSEPSAVEPASSASSAEDAAAEPASGSTVYMTTDISSEGLMAVYKALKASPEGKIAVKLSTGEPGSNYLRTDLIGELVQSLDAAIVECNTAYGGSRSNTAMHKQVAADHGYTDIAEVDIMDEEGELALPVTGGDNLKEKHHTAGNFQNRAVHGIV